MIRQLSYKPLHQLRTILAQVRPKDYATSATLLDGASMGKHVRHIIEFYTCLIRGAASGNICYDDRERNVVLEEDPEAASQAIQQIIVAMDSLPVQKKISMKTRHGDSELQVQTTVERELIFAAEHTVHHLAIIRMLISSTHSYIVIDETLGYSDATLQFLQQQNIAG